MSKNILALPFWKLSLRYSVTFIVVISILLTVLSFIENGNLNAISESLHDGSWQPYTLNRAVLSIIYGASMAFFSRRKARKIGRK